MVMLEDLFVNICIVTALLFVYMKLRWGSREKQNTHGFLT